MSLKAKFNEIAERYTPAQVKSWTQADIDRFAKVDPVNAGRIRALQTTGTISWAGGVAGFVLGAAFFWKRGGTVNGATVAAIIGGIPSYMVGHEATHQVLTFTHELYKFNAMDANKAFLGWWAKNGGAI